MIDKFPVIINWREENEGWPEFVRLSELSETQALKNHSQTLKRLAERGGMNPREITGNIKGVGWCELGGISDEEIKETLSKIAV